MRRCLLRHATMTFLIGSAFVHERKNLPAALTQEFLRRLPHQLSCSLVDVCVPPILVEAYKSIADALKNLDGPLVRFIEGDLQGDTPNSRLGHRAERRQEHVN